MRFVDPFAILQYLGGAISFHFGMTIYAAWVVTDLKDKLDCYEEAYNVKRATMFDDVYTMLIAHVLCIVFATVRQCFPSSTNSGTFWRAVLNQAKIWTYLCSLFYVIMKLSQLNLVSSE